jgi:nitroreductase
MPEEDVQRLLSLAVLAPTSFNIQHWRFVHVQDQETRRMLRAAAWGQAQVTDASMLLVICGDTDAWKKQPERYWQDAPPAVGEMMVPMLSQFYDGREQIQRDECMRSAGLAAQTLMLAATAMGYGTSPMIGFDEEAAARIINLPADHVICMMLAIGKGIKEAFGRGGQLSLDEVVIGDSFA